MNGDNLGNRLGGHAQRVVGLSESIEHGQLGIDLAQAFIIDNQQGIHVFRHLFHAVEGLVDLLRSFETEGNGDDTHREDAHLLGDAGNDGGCTSARAATHTGGDEGHLRAVAEHVLHILNAFLGSLTGFLGFVTGSKAFLTQLQMYGYG